ncbi:GcrA family cell cycle regulator [Brevundimonas diminuta]|jgi:GcrA cell cycle regulator|uniref:GcrA cell cycle regulator n=1 Tax=Brevundimonas bullata TaxID=13160 RepID=A0A7W7ISQ3_9CAUL|nr:MULTISPECIES: GcrA family cell cycle regulator [Brevundimonas]MBB4799618.1 GcrA cell cycle regulator [Brevundimonas bullata]MBB6384311.1 GcrA cell cycle regulator [Brevundimonas bullata]MEC7798192.1 GcrA family cell cycle regulator [Pseudomonadota bacterium]HBY44116.1 GcrA cell cycle regulator [Brevundimonas sp.]
MSASVWTVERIRRLIALWGEGRTAAAIADRLGPEISRCAVLGKVHRLGLVRAAPARPPSRPRGASAFPKRRFQQVAPSRPASQVSSPAAPERPEATVLSVRRGQCRWPYGTPGSVDFGLCGHAVARGAFCAAHAAIGYQTRPMSAEGLMRLAGFGHDPS